MNWVYIPPIDMEWEADAKVGSKDNIDHVPSGGNVTIKSNPVKWKADAKVKSLDEKHMAMVEKVLSAPKKDHVRWIKLPPTIPASKYKHVEYTRNGVYAIVEPVRIEAKSKISFLKPQNNHPKSNALTDNIDVTRRIKLTKNSRVDNYKKVKQTESGNYVVVDPVKIEAKPKVDFPKPDFAKDFKNRRKSDKLKHKYPFF